MTVLWASVLVGCFWEHQEQQWQERLFQMEDHEVDGRAAFRAIARGDLDGAHAAAARLATEDEVPKISDAGRTHLAAVRAEAQRASQATDRAGVASALVAMTGHCAACHASYDLGAPTLIPDEQPVDSVFAALAFESEADWARAASQLGLEASGWDARRAAVARHLGG